MELLRPNTPNAPMPPAGPGMSKSGAGRGSDEGPGHLPGPTAEWFYLDPTPMDDLMDQMDPMDDYRSPARMR